MVIKVTSFGISNPLYKQAMEVRRRVFVEELGLDPEYDFDGKDDEAVHFLMIIDDQPAGAARWLEAKEGILIERLSIIPEYRDLGLGTFLLRYVVKDVLPSKKTIYLYAPEYLSDFFQWNGFQIQGEKQDMRGVPHYKMVYVKEKEQRQGLLKKLFKRN